MQKNQEKTFKEKIFFDGQIYDAYSLIINIIRSAKSKILIIDNYIDDTILEMLAKKNQDVKVVILTSKLKDLGKKCFAISKIEDIEYIEKISKIEVPN